MGASCQPGSAYCQDCPVRHFEPCRDNNPAYAVFGKLDWGPFTLKGEFAKTTDVWPGTFNPEIPHFAASSVTAFDIGTKYRFGTGAGPLGVSVEFSRLVTGPAGAPWERQDQTVVGAAWFAESSVKLFAELVAISGYAPLNFIGGSSVRDATGTVDHTRTPTATAQRVPRSSASV